MSIDAIKQALEYTRPGAIVPVTPETVKILVDALRLAIEQAESAVAAEREACAKVCDDLVLHQYSASGCAAAIRARGQHG